MTDRIVLMTEGLPLDGVGLEIAPLSRPTVRKSEHKVCYVDYCSAAELRKKNKTNFAMKPENIVEIDHIWKPNKRLVKCLPPGTLFDYAIASHVIEHVPNPIGWLGQILEVLRPQGIIVLAVPEKRVTFDAYRTDTCVADLIDCWIRDISIPSPFQIFDCLANAVDTRGKPDYPGLKPGVPFEAEYRLYTDQLALEYAINSWQTQTYIDVHTFCYTPQQFIDIFRKICSLGILPIKVSDPVETPVGEFFVRMERVGSNPPMAAPKISAIQSRITFLARCVRKAKRILKRIRSRETSPKP